MAAVLLMFGGVHAQAQSDIKDRVVVAISQGDAAVLAKAMVANVDLTLPSGSDYYSKAQAEQILRKFFEEHQPKGMKVEHEGTNRGGDSYYIGSLSTEKGEFRVTFFMKKADDGYQVKQLRVETGRSDR